MSRKPLLIVGLDGATFDLIDPLAAQGSIPHLQNIMDRGEKAKLLSTWPPLTLPAWTSFLTGVDPSFHGITDLLMRWPTHDKLAPANARARTLPTFLSHLSKRGLRVAALGVPGTYPPEEINGVHISGFDAPGADRAQRDAVWPPEYWQDLEAAGGWRYATFNEHRGGEESLDVALSGMLDDIEHKEKIILDLLNREAWDVFFVHLQASDTAAHHFWHTYDKNSPRYLGDRYAHLLPTIYSRLDSLIGKMLEAGGPDCQVLLVSDHGMGGSSVERVHLNRFLAEHGFLSFQGSSKTKIKHAYGKFMRHLLGRLPKGAPGKIRRLIPEQLFGSALGVLRGQHIDWANTLAFSDEFDYSPAIWLHSKDRFVHGTMSPEEKEEHLKKLEAVCRQLKDPAGRSLIKRTYRPSEVYSGPHLERLPDLILEPAWLDGYRVSFLPSEGKGPWYTVAKSGEWFAPKGYGMPGVHQREGVFMLAGHEKPLGVRDRLNIEEAGCMVYDLVGQDRPGCIKEYEMQTNQPQNENSFSENRSVEERLRALGYL